MVLQLACFSVFVQFESFILYVSFAASFVFARRLLLVFQLPSLLLILQLPTSLMDSCISFSKKSVSNVDTFVSFEIKFCFCDEASIDFSASEASFGFSASKASFGLASFGIRSSTNGASNVPSFSCSSAISSLEDPLREGIRIIYAMFVYIPFIVWKNADASTISKQEVGNHAVIDCILLYGLGIMDRI